MVSQIAKRIVYPALYWTLLVSSAFVGIGGMSIQAAPDRVIRLLWINDGILAAFTFLVAIIVFAVRSKKTSPEELMDNSR